MSALTGKGEVVAAGQLGNGGHGTKCCKHIFVLLSYSIDRNLFRLRKGIAVRLENSPVFEKGLLHKLVR